MIFRPFYYYDTGCAAYLFGCASQAKCAVVDAQERDIDAYIAFAAQKGMAITHVIDTHVHADHVSGGRLLADRVGAVYALHESAEVSFAFEKLHDGQVIELGNTTVKVLHTPGHSEESISLLVTDLRRGPEPWFVLTGDTLFTGSVGRPDLHSRAREFAGKLHASLHDKLMTLPDDIEVYPGHFSGSVCGVGMSGKPSSTIGFEKRWNALLSRSRDEFIDAMSEVPPKPADMERILRLNRGTLETAA
ncbi:MAG: MBL fold metallo-hydrolase [Devosia nanyangense]|uniref:MBL fold metallo-hydrolase n=1 Tax=Devosia nanyangense TaxID=1228055 RepID=A0A933L2C3_9HYPH|nr:MBL fold metallo-hydrolase [Devosia nanyangense]